MTMSSSAAMSAQQRLDNAIITHEQAEVEVERLCDILERAADALTKARLTKRIAQKELDEAAKAAKASARHAIVQGRQQAAAVMSGGGALVVSSQPRRPDSAGSQARHAIVQGRQQVAEGALVVSSQPRRSDSAGSQGSGVRRVSNNNAVAIAHSNGNNHRQEHRREEEESEQYTDDAESEYSDEDENEEDYSESESEESTDEDHEDEEDGFDMGDEALEQIRYRLETAKIDPNSPEGTKLLDELLIRLQSANEEVIDSNLVNEFIDELFNENDDLEAERKENKTQQQPPPPPQNPQQHPRIRINRGGKTLGWYQGELDERGYAREGQGSMYYDAGHECHGTWRDDEMIGRGIYQWSDGHVYDGEWLNGKRHGLGRFIRPDNVILCGRYEKGHHKGEGVRWSADRREAQVVVDGVPKKTVSLGKAKEIASNLGFDDVMPPV